MTTDRVPRILLTGVVLELTLATALIHLSLGGTLFFVNGMGYVALAAAYAVATTVPMPVVRRFAWLPRIGLAGFAVITIGAYLVAGPYFALGWITKAVEVAIVGLVLADLVATDGSPANVLRTAADSLVWHGSQRGT